MGLKLNETRQLLVYLKSYVNSFQDNINIIKKNIDASKGVGREVNTEKNKPRRT